MLRITAPLIITAMLAIPLSAQATAEKTFSWAFSTSSGTGTRCIDDGNAATNDGCTSDFDGNLYKFQTSTGNTYQNNVSVAGFSTTNDAITPKNGFETATVKMWDGLGVSSREDAATGAVPHHAMDNDGGFVDGSTTTTEADETADSGDVDAALFSFADAISLTSITIGWTNSSADEVTAARKNDADISVLRYTGTGAPPVIATNAASSTTVNSKTFATLLAEGWEFVGDYANLNSKTVNGIGLNTINTNGKTSSYWLISAYTSAAHGNNTVVANADLDYGNDYFKIAGLGATTVTPPSTQVPEPATLLLLTLGLICWRMTRNDQSLLSLVDPSLRLAA